MKVRFITSVFICIIVISCTKSLDGGENQSISIDKVGGAYKGGTLSWQKNSISGTVSGTDPNVTFTTTYANNRVKVNVITSAPITQKAFDLPLTTKQESPVNNVLTTAYYEFSETANTNTLQNNFVLGYSMMKTASGLTVQGNIFSLTVTNPFGSNPASEQVKISSCTKQ
jgi:hypothetical protein